MWQQPVSHDLERAHMADLQTGPQIAAANAYESLSTPIVKTAELDDKERLVGVLVLAFARDPVTRWTFPDPHQYLAVFPPFVDAFGGRAFQHGSAHYADQFAGGALWLPPGVHPDEATL